MLHCKLKIVVVHITTHVASCGDMLLEEEMRLTSCNMLLQLAKQWQHVQLRCNIAARQVAGKMFLVWFGRGVPRDQSWPINFGVDSNMYILVSSLGKYRDMIVTFTFSRRIGYYLINFYVPCIIMVIMSWIVFWMDRDCIGDRIALGITTVLTIVFLLGSSNSTMPRVSYPKAIDWYLMTSFIFVFTTLIMCLLIFRFDRQLGKQQRPPRSVSGEPPAEATSMQVLMEIFSLRCCHDKITRLTAIYTLPSLIQSKLS